MQAEYQTRSPEDNKARDCPESPDLPWPTSTPVELGTRVFSAKDQESFAELSGDWNPIHLDPVASRRQMFGEVVVHGINGLLAGLDCVLSRLGTRRIGISEVAADFREPVVLDQVVVYILSEFQPNGCKIEMHQNARRCGVFSFTWAHPLEDSEPVTTGSLQASRPLAQTPESSASYDEVLPITVDPKRVRTDYPSVFKSIDLGTVGLFLALSRVVGMRCPGEQSLFMSFKLSIVSPIRKSVRFRVKQVSERLGRIEIDVSGWGVSGTVTALFRPRPKEPATYKEVVDLLPTGLDLSGQTALVVGGSRGLGALTTKIIAAAGGTSILTYKSGKTEALEILRQIRTGGGKAECIRYDVEHPEGLRESLAKVADKIHHLYYFAAPPGLLSITSRPGRPTKGYKASSHAALRPHYYRVFVDGLSDTIDQLKGVRAYPLTVFYPSTTFLDLADETFAEYRAAKDSAEALCRSLASMVKDYNVIFDRLPRLETDQTLSILPVRTENPLPYLLEVISRVSASDRNLRRT